MLLLSNVISASYIHIPIWTSSDNFSDYFYYFAYLPRPFILLGHDSLYILKQIAFSLIIIIFFAELTLTLVISAKVTQEHK